MMKRVAFLLLALVSVSVNCLKSAKECNPFLNCPLPKEKIFSGNFLPDEKFLNENCGIILEHFQCVADHDDVCSIENYMRKTYVDFTVLRRIANKICPKDSSTRKSYLELVECVNTNKEDFVKGYSSVGNIISEFGKRHVPDNLNGERITSCMVEKYIRPELQQELELFCSAADLKEIVTEIWYLLIGPEKEKCQLHNEIIERYITHYENLKQELGYKFLISPKYALNNKAINDRSQPSLFIFLFVFLFVNYFVHELFS